MKKLTWIPPTIILLIIIVFFIATKYQNPICGDGICQKDELNYCYLDCQCPTAGLSADECSTGWQSVYLDLAEQGIINKNHLEENNIIDYSNQEIQALANQLKRDTPKETVKAIAKYTYQNIYYNFNHKYLDCLGYKSSDVLEREEGVCSTMSKLNIALLRANNIPAYSVTGCFKFNTACKLKQTLFGIRFPKFIDIQVDGTGYAPTLGYLHNWVIVDLYEDGNIEPIVIESTTGQVFENSCINYRYYYENPDDTKACGLSSFDHNLQDCKDW